MPMPRSYNCNVISTPRSQGTLQKRRAKNPQCQRTGKPVVRLREITGRLCSCFLNNVVACKIPEISVDMPVWTGKSHTASALDKKLQAINGCWGENQSSPGMGPGYVQSSVDSPKLIHTQEDKVGSSEYVYKCICVCVTVITKERGGMNLRRNGERVARKRGLVENVNIVFTNEILNK